MPMKIKYRTSRERIDRNSMLLPEKEVKLTGAELAFVAHAVERIPPAARTEMEKELYAKVRS